MYRTWQIIGAVFLGIGLAELIMRGLVDGSTAGAAIGVVCLTTAASSFWEARSQKRSARARWNEIRHLPSTSNSNSNSTSTSTSTERR